MLVFATMREVFVNQDHARVGFYKSVLDNAGIPSFVRNESSNNSVTELPSPLFFPTLCVLNDEDYDRAMQVLDEIHNAQPSNEPDWVCPKCGESVPGNFDACWKCETVRAESV